tara:strand:+ start:1534 stop:1767 length:234 start_codon:yes stop_codon:yes gene_type:complete
MVRIFNSDVISFLDNNEFGITEKDLKSDRIEVLETILFFKIDNLMNKHKSFNYGLFSELSDTKDNLKYSLDNPNFTY